MLEEERNFWLS